MKRRRGPRGGPEKLKRIYKQRHFDLKAMGFDSYDAYLKSDLWIGIRRKVLELSPICTVCERNPATQVHHRKYIRKVLDGRDMRWFYAVCGGCHFTAEFREHDGAKLTPNQASTKMKQMRHRYAEERWDEEANRDVPLDC